MLTVWIQAWEMQCCGRPFEVGSDVHWHLNEPDYDFAAAVLGDDLALSLTHAEEHHHTDPGDDAPNTTGIVVSIRAVRCRYASYETVLGKRGYPVSGSARIIEKESANGWEAEDDEMQFVAYLVELNETASLERG